MPARAPSANPFRNLHLSHQAEAGLLLTMKCGLCGRKAHYWATDLLRVVGPQHQAHIAPFACAKCRTKEYIDLWWTKPSAADLQAGLTVRRPVRKITKWIWRNERS